jgi:hypothetical protein
VQSSLLSPDAENLHAGAEVDFRGRNAYMALIDPRRVTL